MNQQERDAAELERTAGEQVIRDMIEARGGSASNRDGSASNRGDNASNAAMAETATSGIGRGMRGTTPEDVKMADDAGTLARLLVRQGVWEALLDRFSLGRFPATRTGDYSDVTVRTPQGEIPWTEVARFSAQEMTALARDVEGNLAPLLFALLLHGQEGRMEELLTLVRRQEASLRAETDGTA